MDVSIEMNRDKITLTRTVYNSLDVLADIGGLNSLIVSAIATFISIWNYGHFETKMAKQLYMIKDDPLEERKSARKSF